MPPYPVLVLQNDPREGLGLIEPALDAMGLRSNVLEMWAGDRVPSTISGYRQLIVLGGPQAAYNAPHVPYLADEMRAIREAAATRTPVLGVCLGAQLVAHALGGRAYAGPKPELGWLPVERSAEGRADKVLRHLPDDLPVFQWHGDTFDLPEGATRLASSPAYPNQAFVTGFDVYGLQFHLEWDLPILEAVTAGEEADLRAAGVTRDEVLAGFDANRKRLEEAASRVFHAFLMECGCND